MLLCLGRGKIHAMAKNQHNGSFRSITDVIYDKKRFYFIHKRLRNTAQPSMDFYQSVHMCRKINCLQDVYFFITFYVGLNSVNYGGVLRILGLHGQLCNICDTSKAAIVVMFGYSIYLPMT